MPLKDPDAKRAYMREWYARPENRKRVIKKVWARKKKQYAGKCINCGGKTVGNNGPGSAPQWCAKPECASAQRRAIEEELVIMACLNCVSGPAAEYQDKKYGKNQRVHARTRQQKPESEHRWRCTVCGAEK